MTTMVFLRIATCWYMWKEMMKKQTKEGEEEEEEVSKEVMASDSEATWQDNMETLEGSANTMRDDGCALSKEEVAQVTPARTFLVKILVPTIPLSTKDKRFYPIIRGNEKNLIEQFNHYPWNRPADCLGPTGSGSSRRTVISVRHGSSSCPWEECELPSTKGTRDCLRDGRGSLDCGSSLGAWAS